MPPSEQADNTPPVTNSTAADSQTTSSSETPSSGVNADRQPVATQHRQKPMSTSEEKEEFPDSVSDEVAEILAAWPKVISAANHCLHALCEKLMLFFTVAQWVEFR